MFLQGLILGFSIAAPVGPIGLLCLQRTLAHGRLHGFISGLGAATADACYGLLAAFGLGVLISALLGIQFWVQLAGGFFLLWLGCTNLAAQSATNVAPAQERSGRLAAFTSVFFLTLANPATILSFLAVFAGLGVTTETGSALALVAGVFLGSASWWLLLSFSAGLLRPYLRAGRLRFVNVLAGLSLIALALSSLWPIINRKS